jgi:hypothetical protein
MKIGKKVRITRHGVITTYTRRLYPGDIYSTTSHREKLTYGLLKQLLADYISQKWQKLFSSIFGTDGFASRVQYYLIPALIVVCLLAALVSMLQIVYKT